jgi:hypothetical protein
MKRAIPLLTVNSIGIRLWYSLSEGLLSLYTNYSITFLTPLFLLENYREAGDCRGDSGRGLQGQVIRCG